MNVSCWILVRQRQHWWKETLAVDTSGCFMITMPLNVLGMRNKLGRRLIDCAANGPGWASFGPLMLLGAINLSQTPHGNDV